MIATARRFLATLHLLAASAFAFAAVAPAASAADDADCGYPVANCDGPTLTVTRTVLEHGEVFGVQGTNFLAGKSVTLFMEKVRSVQGFRTLQAAPQRFTLKTLRTSSDGSFTTSVTTPKGAALGKQDIVAVNATPAGFDDPRARVTVVDDNNRNPDNNDDNTTPAFTGFNMLWLLLLAAALIALGGYAARRGRRGPSVRSIHG